MATNETLKDQQGFLSLIIFISKLYEVDNFYFIHHFILFVNHLVDF